MFFVVALLVQILVLAGCLWGGMKLAKVQGEFMPMLAIAAICCLVGLIPYAGMIASIIVMLILISKWTGATLWPDAVLIAVLSKALGLGLAFVLMALKS